MTGDESPFDSTATRERKRMLPSVSEVVRLLAQRSPGSDPAQIFRAARQVCADELMRVKDGLEAVPAEELAARAAGYLAHGFPQPAPPPAAPAPPPAPPVSLAPRPFSPDEPFAETTGALDLQWEGEGREPLGSEPAQPLLPAGGAPVPFAVPSEEAADSPFELDEPPAPPTLPAPPGVAALVSSAPAPPAPVPPSVPAVEPGEGPGEETISRLEREAASVAFASVLPGASHREADDVTIAAPLPAPRLHEEEVTVAALLPSPVPSPAPPPTEALPPVRFGAEERQAAPTEPLPPLEEAAPPVLPPEEPAEERLPFEAHAGAAPRGPRPWLLAASAVLLAGAAGAAYLFLGGKAMAPGERPPAAGTSAAQTGAPPSAGPASEVAPTPSPAPATGIAGAPAAPGEALPGPGEPASAAPPAPVEATPAPPTPVPSTAVPTPVPTAAPVAVPTLVPTRPARQAPPPAPVAVSPKPAPAGEAPRQSRAAPLLSSEWGGKPPAFVLHFSSYRDRKLAETDAAKLSKRFGREAFAVAVDLGEKGTYFRSVVAGFATAEEALAFREELLAQGTPNVGFVYRVSGK